MSSSSAAFDESHAIKCELASEVLNRSGSLRLKVMGWSMLPAVWPGDTLVCSAKVTRRYEDRGERKVDLELLCTRVETGGAAIKGEATFVVP